jgi:hypothetical protein
MAWGITKIIGKWKIVPIIFCVVGDRLTIDIGCIIIWKGTWNKVRHKVGG